MYQCINRFVNNNLFEYFFGFFSFENENEKQDYDDFVCMFALTRCNRLSLPFTCARSRTLETKE